MDEQFIRDRISSLRQEKQISERKTTPEEAVRYLAGELKKNRA